MEKTSEKVDLCDKKIIHEEILSKVKSNILDDSSLYEMGEFFKVFGDNSRLKILNALLISEMCVCDISVLLGMNQPAISHHLKVLRQAKLIKSRREGSIVYYSLADENTKEGYLIRGLFKLIKDFSNL